MFDYLIDKMDGKEFDTYAEYEEAIHTLAYDIEEELGRAERWACQRDKEVTNQLGVTIQELEDEDEANRVEAY